MRIVLVGPRALAASWRRSFRNTDVDNVYGDIIKAAKGGALVSPANSFGWMTGGLDDLIRLAYEEDGFDIMAAVRTEIAEGTSERCRLAAPSSCRRPARATHTSSWRRPCVCLHACRSR